MVRYPTSEHKQATEWHRISTNNHLAEIASKYLKKGGKVYVEGSLRTRKWKDQSGIDREVTEIRADELMSCNYCELLCSGLITKYC